MAAGLRVQLSVEAPSYCPLVTTAGESDAPITDITRTRGDGDTVAEEFQIPQSAADDVPDTADPVIDVGDRRIFRLERGQSADCICARVESFGYPVREVKAVDGELRLTFHLTDLEPLREIVADLSEFADRVEVNYLVHDEADDDSENPVVVDRSEMTDRQREVLETAVRMGYFEFPRAADGSAVADELGINDSTFAEHLRVAQAKLLENVVDA
ncbi:helix-turn-helix domain-containing protein [Haloarcula halophila]|uniref:helix-turn-helix domain-containing protein n=1 Tax=Haloarcula TaxID=2237 RepID=UPI0023E3A61E|nr:helix-turn-helix domain-containing protein [Halomicroarcula sp. DFY41]